MAIVQNIKVEQLVGSQLFCKDIFTKTDKTSLPAELTCQKSRKYEY